MEGRYGLEWREVSGALGPTKTNQPLVRSRHAICTWHDQFLRVRRAHQGYHQEAREPAQEGRTWPPRRHRRHLQNSLDEIESFWELHVPAVKYVYSPVRPSWKLLQTRLKSQISGFLLLSTSEGTVQAVTWRVSVERAAAANAIGQISFRFASLKAQTTQSRGGSCVNGIQK